MIKVIIADDHPVVLKGIRQILEETSDIIVVDEADNGKDTLKKVLENKYDVILLDISLPYMNGLEVLKELKAKKINTPVLILSIYSEEQYALRTLRAGASGYLTKGNLPDELIQAIRNLARGKKYISPYISELLINNIKNSQAKAPHETLSDRELQIMCMLASGKTGNDIATELSLSIKTINTYRSRIMKKMGMKNNATLIRYAIENKMIY
ncbi:MAG TPA: response regulator transcription factor [Candidatus Eremiobacteraeota bacterium]|nr:MAG: Response regulator UvrY [bacterium ADurb.Bin363]HPZ07148.1 response regulator transcription factor [Candidatus Eremiobacteraeota bacterium]